MSVSDHARLSATQDIKKRNRWPILDNNHQPWNLFANTNIWSSIDVKKKSRFFCSPYKKQCCRTERKRHTHRWPETVKTSMRCFEYVSGVKSVIASRGSHLCMCAVWPLTVPFAWRGRFRCCHTQKQGSKFHGSGFPQATTAPHRHSPGWGNVGVIKWQIGTRTVPDDVILSITQLKRNDSRFRDSKQGRPFTLHSIKQVRFSQLSWTSVSCS